MQAISVKNLALIRRHHCANEFFIVDIALRVLLINQKLLNLKKLVCLQLTFQNVYKNGKFPTFKIEG